MAMFSKILLQLNDYVENMNSMLVFFTKRKLLSLLSNGMKRFIFKVRIILVMINV